MGKQGRIEHIGIVESIDNGEIIVSISSQSACASCHAKGACGMSESKEKHINITENSNNFNVGDKVNVIMAKSQGVVALFWGYLLPFLVMFTTLLIVNYTTNSEAYSAIFSVLILAPYYFMLYIFRNKLLNNFQFNIEKL